MSADRNVPGPSRGFRVDAPAAPPGQVVAGLKVAASQAPSARDAPSHGEPQGPPQPRQSSRSADFFALVGCNAIVFGASVCIMVLELTASRLIAAYVGQSLYTWTSVIGVVLAGISIGNYAGGWLADRYAPRKTLAWLFLASGLLTFSVLILNNLAAAIERPDWINWQWWVMLLVGLVFFWPALLLGTISPVTASMAIKRSAKTGIAVGNIYAWGALGSIVGTFLTGFWLIGEFGSGQVIWMTSGALILMAALVAAGQRVFRGVALLGVLPFVVQYGLFSSATGEQVANVSRTIAGVRSLWRTAPADFAADEEALLEAAEGKDEAALLAARERNEWRTARRAAEEGWAQWGARLGTQMHGLGLSLALRRDDPAQYNDESDYFAINIATLGAGDEVVKALSLDHLIHSYYSARNPGKLYYEYEQIYAAVTERAASQWDRESSVRLAERPSDGLLAALPDDLEYDPSSVSLSILGPIDFERFRRLLSIGPYVEFAEALFAIWEEAKGDWSTSSRRIGGILAMPLRRLPRGVVFPPELEARVHYDRVLKSIVCTAPFDLKELTRILAQGEMQPYVAAIEELYGRSRRTSALFIGGGGYVFPRWIEANFPDEPQIDVAEIDLAVRVAAEKQLGLSREYGSPADGRTYVRTHVGDARKFVDDRVRANAQPASREEIQRFVRYDFIYGDAFNDMSVPWHLTTREFSQKVKELLSPEGVYLVNIIDVYPRAQFPTATEKAGKAETAFAGRLPQGLAPKKIPAGDFVPCGGSFPGLEVSRSGQFLVLRYDGVMSADTRDQLSRLAAGGKDAAAGSGFGRAVAELYAQSNGRALLPGAAPRGLLSAAPSDAPWQSSPAPFEGWEVFQRGDEGFLLGFRGVMPKAKRDRWMKLAGKNEKLKAAVDSLYRQSHKEQVGQFMGRYVNTVRQVFPCVYVFTSHKLAPQDVRDTFVVVCSLKPLDCRDLERSGGYWRNGPFAWTETDGDGNTTDSGQMPAILELARGKILTDDFAPVDNLLARVPTNRAKQE